MINMMSMSLPLIASLPLATEKPEEILHFTVSAHQASVQSIWSFYCRIEMPQSGISGEYWRSGGTVRMRQRAGNRSDELLVENGLIKSIGHLKAANGIEETVAGISRWRGILGNCDPWFLGCISIHGPDFKAYSLDDLINHHHILKDAKRVVESDHELIYISIEFDKIRHQLWFDPRFNYMLRRRLTSITNDNFREQGGVEVRKFREAAPGIYFPEEVVTITPGENGQLNSTPLASFQDIRINATDFSIPKISFVRGMSLSDSIQGRSYRVDENGVEIGIDPRVHVSLTPPPIPAHSHSDMTVSHSESTPMTYWILPASLVLLCVAGCLWVVRKRRARDCS